MENIEFNTPEFWRHEPLVAFEAWLGSDEFSQTRRIATQFGDDHRLRGDSITVYRTMFQKFLRHMVARGHSLMNTQESDTADFFSQVMPFSSSETRAGYARLTERVYEHLRQSGFIAFNPISTWVRDDGDAKSRDFESPTPETCLVTPLAICRLERWCRRSAALSCPIFVQKRS